MESAAKELAAQLSAPPDEPTVVAWLGSSCPGEAAVVSASYSGATPAWQVHKPEVYQGEFIVASVQAFDRSMVRQVQRFITGAIEARIGRARPIDPEVATER